MGDKNTGGDIMGTVVRYPCPIVTLQGKTKKKCCKKFKKGKRCKKCPGNKRK
jgi:hypothetical protein